MQVLFRVQAEFPAEGLLVLEVARNSGRRKSIITAPVTGVFLASMPWSCSRLAVRLPQQVWMQCLALPFMLNQSPSSWVSESICSQWRLTILSQ